MAKKKSKKPVKKTAKKSAKKAAKKKPVVKKTAAKKPAVTSAKRTTSINPYLTFSGNCEAAFNFYRSVFGGKFGYVGRFNEMPPMGDKPLSADEGNKIMHMSLPIGGNSVLMGSDTTGAFGPVTTAGNNFSISVNAVSKKEADHLYNGLSAGGHAGMPMSKTFWGAYFGMCTDKFGIQWMISFEETPM